MSPVGRQQAVSESGTEGARYLLALVEGIGILDQRLMDQDEISQVDPRRPCDPRDDR